MSVKWILGGITMSTCKECIHYEACEYWLKKENKHLGAVEGFVCEFFKDRSKFIELPCNIGDTVYSTKQNKVDECYVVSIQICTRVSITIRLATKYFIFYDVSGEDFGKAVFLTKEEAEQALAERSKTK